MIQPFLILDDKQVCDSYEFTTTDDESLTEPNFNKVVSSKRPQKRMLYNYFIFIKYLDLFIIATLKCWLVPSLCFM